MTDPRGDTADHFKASHGSEPEGRPRYRQIVKLLTQLLPDPTTRLVVEIGAGRGALGVMLSQRFQYIGFEPAAGLSDSARAVGVRIHVETFATERLPQPADAVVLDNVLEHVLDPVGLLRQGVGALRPGGYVVVIVPNVGDLRRFHPRWRWRRHWVPPDHINYFRFRDIETVMTQLGLRVAAFSFGALSWPEDLRVAPRAAAERLGVYPFGLNLYGQLSRSAPHDRPAPTKGRP